MRHKRMHPVYVWVALLHWTICGAAHAQPAEVRPKWKLAVVDATGELLGPVFGFDYSLTSPIIALTIREQVFVLRVTKDFLWGNLPYVWYLSPDCTGTPYLATIYAPVPPVVILNPGNLAFIPESGANQELIEFHSIQDRTDDGCHETYGTLLAVRAYGPIDLQAYFTPPFRVR